MLEAVEVTSAEGHVKERVSPGEGHAAMIHFGFHPPPLRYALPTTLLANATLARWGKKQEFPSDCNRGPAHFLT